MRPVYLDNNATTRVDPERRRRDAAVSSPSTSATRRRRTGSAAPRRQAMKAARESVAALVGAGLDDEILFTSGGTESDNTAILGRSGGRTRTATKSSSRPSSIPRCWRWSPIWQAVGPDQGARHPGPQLRLPRPRALPRRAFVAGRARLDHVGEQRDRASCFPSRRSPKRRRRSARSSTPTPFRRPDARRSICSAAPIDLLSLSAHKLHGPKGVGALYVRRGLKLAADDRRRTAGTRRGAAAPRTLPESSASARRRRSPRRGCRGDAARMRALRDRLESGLARPHPGRRGFGGIAPRLPNTSAIVCAGAEAEAIATMLGRDGIAVSTGAACSAGSHAPSHVLQRDEHSCRHGPGRGPLFALARQPTTTTSIASWPRCRQIVAPAARAGARAEDSDAPRTTSRRPMPEARAIGDASASGLAQRHDAARRRADAGRRLHARRKGRHRRGARRTPACPNSKPARRRWATRRAKRCARSSRAISASACSPGAAWARRTSTRRVEPRVGAVNLSIPASDRLLERQARPRPRGGAGARAPLRADGARRRLRSRGRRRGRFARGSRASAASRRMRGRGRGPFGCGSPTRSACSIRSRPMSLSRDRRCDRLARDRISWPRRLRHGDRQLRSRRCGPARRTSP